MAGLPSCADHNDVDSHYHPRDLPGSHRKDGPQLSTKTHGNKYVNSPRNTQSPVMPRGSSISSAQLLAQRRIFSESQTERTNFHMLLEPSSSQVPGLAPYRTVLGDVKEKHFFGSGILADGFLADLIRRVATFAMVLMKLDLRQESGKHLETLDAITKYLDIGTYSERDEHKKLEILTRDLKGKRPLVPPSIEGIACLLLQTESCPKDVFLRASSSSLGRRQPRLNIVAVMDLWPFNSLWELVRVIRITLPNKQEQLVLFQQQLHCCALTPTLPRRQITTLLFLH